MPNDELRTLVEEDLSVLAYQIMSSGPRHMPSASFINRNRNWAHSESTDWGRLDREGRLVYSGPDSINGSDAYLYRGRNYDGHPIDQWYIAFYNIRLVDIDSVDPQPVEVLNPEAVKLVSVDKKRNNGPGFINYDISVSERHDRSKEHTFGATASAEFEVTMKRKAGVDVGGVSGSQEMTARFAAKLETRTDHAWRSSDSLETAVRKSFRIFPYHDFELLVKEGTPKIRQVIPTKGLLECSIRIDIQNANSQDFDTYDDLVQVWRGLKSGSEAYSGYFAGGHAVPDSEIEWWLRPRINLDITVEGDRVRYSDEDIRHAPIPGKEELAEEYRVATRDAI